MTGKVLELDQVMESRDHLATAISDKWMTWNTYRQAWSDEKRELRNYLFATDTTTTTNNDNGWSNSTTVPKLTQIRDNLHANYMAALFPHREWLQWEGNNQDAVSMQTAKAVEAYMTNKLEQSKFQETVSQLVLDYIDYGNCFSMTDWSAKVTEDPLTGETIKNYVGPVMHRISPNDIVFNPLAKKFEDSPVIIRTVTSIGELMKMKNSFAEPDKRELAEAALAELFNFRQRIAEMDATDAALQERLQFDGFGSLHEYYGSDSVEILSFYGDIYDTSNGELLEDHVIHVIDKSHVFYKEKQESWLGTKPIFHVGWRERPDNLYAMGPLDNLVGMQYRIDHLENLKADVFDLIAQPVLKIRGDVEDFEYEPGERIYLGDEGDVVFLVPDATALNADMQINMLEQRMELLAGAPREAMGIRSAGEKTAFEVGQLATASGRIFEHKSKRFEELFLERNLQSMLEISKRKMDTTDVIRTIDNETGAVLFQNITKEDITADGQLKPRGAAHFARQNQMAMSLNQLASSAVYNDPAVNVHMSGIALAKAIEDVAGLDQFNLVGENIRVYEQAETQRTVNAAQQQVAEEDSIEGLPDEGIIA